MLVVCRVLSEYLLDLLQMPVDFRSVVVLVNLFLGGVSPPNLLLVPKPSFCDCRGRRFPLQRPLQEAFGELLVPVLI